MKMRYVIYLNGEKLHSRSYKHDVHLQDFLDSEIEKKKKVLARSFIVYHEWEYKVKGKNWK